MKGNNELMDYGAASPLAEELSWWGKVHCGDCLTLMGKMPAASVGLIVTSPPYNLRNSTGNGLKDGRGGKWPRAGLIHGYHGHADNLPAQAYIQWQRLCLTAMMRLLREDGAIFYNHKWRVQAGLLQDRSEIVEGFSGPANHHLETRWWDQFQPRLFPSHLRGYLPDRPGPRFAFDRRRTP